MLETFLTVTLDSLLEWNNAPPMLVDVNHKMWTDCDNIAWDLMLNKLMIQLVKLKKVLNKPSRDWPCFD